MTRASEKMCDVLIEAGIDHVFGIPGGGTIPIWNALYDRQDSIKALLCRHEQSAGCMADMYGRLTGKPGVLMGQGAFIASSGAFGIMEGFLSGSPMVVIADTSDAGFSQYGTYQSGSGEYGSCDIVTVLRSMSKFITYAVTPEEAVHGVQLAIKHAQTGRPGPACVVVRNSAVTGEFDTEKAPRTYPTAGYLNESLSAPPAEDIERAGQLILQAQHPVIIAGNGVHSSKAYNELKELAEFLGIGVATSYKGKSSFPEVHPLALGMMGTFGQRVANNVIAEADLILVAGCSLSPSDTKSASPQLIDPSRQTIIQIDIDSRNSGWTYPVEMALSGDLKPVLSQLLSAVKRLAGANDTVAAERLASLRERKNKEDFFEAAELYSDASPILPQRIVREIEEAVDASTLITLDGDYAELRMDPNGTIIRVGENTNFRIDGLQIAQYLLDDEFCPSVRIRGGHGKSLGDGDRAGISVHRGRRTEDDRLHSEFFHNFAKNHGAGDVVVVITQGDPDGFFDGFQPREMEDRFDFVAAKHPGQGLFVQQIHAMEAQRAPGNLLHPLQGFLLAVAEIVHGQHLMPRLEELQARMAADITGPARRQYLHGR